MMPLLSVPGRFLHRNYPYFLGLKNGVVQIHHINDTGREKATSFMQAENSSTYYVVATEQGIEE